MKQRTKILGTFALSSVCSGVAYAAMYGYGPAESWTTQQIVVLTADVSTEIAAFGASFGTNMQSKFEQIISALAVATKQEAMSANQISDATVRSAQTLVSALSAQRTSEQVATAVLSYSPKTGQGFDPCGTYAKNTTMDLAFENAAAQARQKVNATDVSPGQFVDSIAVSMQARLENHRNNFCSQAEADQGLCTLSTLPGGDTNAGLLFEPAQPASLHAEARTAYIQHVLGEPDQRLEPVAGTTPAGESYLLEKNRKDALLSIPAYSLAMIDSANTQSDEYSGRTPNEVLKLRVNQYFGGVEAQQWTGAIAAQTQRGLLVEAAKMAGLETWLHQKQYEQNQRLEANLSALLIASADQLSAPLEAQYQQVLSETAKTNIR